MGTQISRSMLLGSDGRKVEMQIIPGFASRPARASIRVHPLLKKDKPITIEMSAAEFRAFVQMVKETEASLP